MTASRQVFVSYAHGDWLQVAADVSWLRDSGFSIYLDERIHAGSEWAEEIATAIADSQAVLFFASSRSLDSSHCRNEIAFAVDAGKFIVTVFIEPVDLGGGMKLMISRSQGLMRWQLEQTDYRRRLDEAVQAAVTREVSLDQPIIHGVWQVRQSRNAGFTGRVDLLNLLQTRVAEQQIVALTGPAGVGKTQLALEYIHRHARGHNLVAWFRAEDPATLVADMVELAVELKLADSNHIDTPLVLEDLRRWLRTARDWILVLDNLETPDLVPQMFPAEHSGLILITSRRQNWGRRASVVAVDTFSDDEAVMFLLTRCESDDRQSARILAQTLGNLPLALEEAAAYVDSTGRSIASYLKLFDAHHASLMARASPASGYSRSLSTTLGITLEQLHQDEPEARTLLEHLAFLAPDGASLAMLENLPFARTRDDDPAPLVIDRCVQALRRYSLVKTHKDAVSTHRLTQLVVRDRLDPHRAAEVGAVTLGLVAGLFPKVSDMGERGDECRQLLPHALTALNFSRDFPEADSIAATLHGRTGTYLSARNQSREAAEHLAEAYRILRHLPAQSGRYARTCELYARVLFVNGSLDHSEQVFSEALAVFESEGPSGLLHLMQVCLDLAWVRWTKGDFRQALEIARRSLDQLESLLGRDDPHRAISLSMISRLHLDLGETKAAVDAVDQVVNAVPKIPMLDRERAPLLCAVYLQLAQVLRSLGRPGEARDWAEESLRLGRGVFSENHALMGASRCVLGQACFDQADYGGARTEFEAAVECVVKHRFPINQHVFLAVPYLVITLLKLDQATAAAEVLKAHGRDLDRQVAGEHAYAAAYMNFARGLLARSENLSDDACRLLEEGDQVLADRYGERSLYRIIPLYWLGRTLEEAGRTNEAREAHALALEIAQAEGIPDHSHCDMHRAILARSSGS